MDNYREQLQEERNELKTRFIKLIEYINSAEFYRLSDNNKQVLRNQKKIMEEYLNILNLRMFENVDSFTITDLEIKSLTYDRC